MFIDQNVKPEPAPFEGAECAEVVTLYLTSAPSNGAGGGIAPRPINMSPLWGLNYADAFKDTQAEQL